MTDGNSVLIGIPDVTIAPSLKPTNQESSPEEIRESYLEVREVATAEVITVIELLSPKNKRVGEGRNADQTKR